jgi:Uma2 family endonuclease
MFERADLVDVILEQSDAVLIVERAQEKLRSEQQKRQEFYDLIDEDTDAEFVNGAVFYRLPAAKRHHDAAKHLFNLLHTFVQRFQLGFVGFQKIMTRFTRNDYEPDICFFQQDKSKDFQPNQVIFPVPDLAVEVLSNSSKKMIRHD